MKLHQLIAIIEGVKAKAAAAKTKIYQNIQKTDLFQGLIRTYQPLQDGDYVYSSENKEVLFRASDLLKEFVGSTTELYNRIYAQDISNTQASADIVIDGVVLVKDVPVTYLLFLEKQLKDYVTFFKNLPVLDPAERWTYDVSNDIYVSQPRVTEKTKKVSKVVTLADATKEHPAQVKEVLEDVVIGEWTNVKQSGALPANVVKNLVLKAEMLIEAVKIAREEANTAVVSERPISDRITGYLLNNNGLPGQ